MFSKCFNVCSAFSMFFKFFQGTVEARLGLQIALKYQNYLRLVFEDSRPLKTMQLLANSRLSANSRCPDKPLTGSAGPLTSLDSAMTGH